MMKVGDLIMIGDFDEDSLFYNPGMKYLKGSVRQIKMIETHGRYGFLYAVEGNHEYVTWWLKAADVSPAVNTRYCEK